MNVWRKSLSGLVAIALVSGAIVGCGGGLSSLPGITPVPVNVDGGVASQEATSTDAVVASDTPQTIIVSVGGVNTSVVIPAGVSVAAGESIGIIPDGTEAIIGLQGGARSPGDIKVNGRACGSKVVNGKIHPAIGFPRGRYTLDAEGPFTIRQGSSVLTMQHVSFTFDCNGHVLSLPTSISGTIPANGSNNWQNSITTAYNSTYGSGTASLTITHANGTLAKTVPVTSGTATFTDLKNDAQSHIPAAGVNMVSFTHVGLTNP